MPRKRQRIRKIESELADARERAHERNKSDDSLFFIDTGREGTREQLQTCVVLTVGAAVWSHRQGQGLLLLIIIILSLSSSNHSCRERGCTS